MSATVLRCVDAIAARGPSPFARADSAMRDDARAVHSELGVIRRDADRDEPDVSGHRVTEVTPSKAAA